MRSSRRSLPPEAELVSSTAVDEAHYRQQLPVSAGDPYAGSRREAVGRFFRDGGFPTAADEEWRFSDLDGLGRTPYHRYPAVVAIPPPTANELPAWIHRFERRVLLAEGGCFDTAETREGGGPVCGARAPSGPAPANGGGTAPGALDTNPLETMNRALFDCGFRVSVRRGMEAEPILLYSLRRDLPDDFPRMLHPRSLVELEPGSRATIVEAHDGESSAAGWTNPSTVCRVGEDAELHFVRLELETGNIVHTSRTTFDLGRNARVFSTVLSLGGGQVRDDTAALLTSESAEADFGGLFFGFGVHKADQHTLAVHAAPRCASRQLYKNVLADRSRAVFDGKVVVAPGAIGTNASQTNRNLLLSAGARVHTKPRLEINADEVRCAHGAAIGRLDEDALFYLRSRGLGRMDSREILIRAFAGEVIGRVPVAAARELAEARVQRLRESAGFAA